MKVCLPWMSGKPESDWARVVQPAAGSGRGFYWLPQVNDEVLVAYEAGQPNRPYVIGCLWNGKDKPPQGAYTDENSTVLIQTGSGHQIILSDKSGEETIAIADKSGNRTLLFDVKNKKLEIDAKAGDVEIHAQKKLLLQCEDLEVKTSKTGKLDVGSDFSLKVADKAAIKAGPQLNLKADRVELNPSSLDLAALAAKALARLARAAQAGQAGPAGGQGQSGGGGAAGGAQARGGSGPGGDLASDVVTPAASPAAAAQEGPAKEADKAATAAPGQVKVTVVSVSGKAQPGLEFELVEPDGKTRHAGKTDNQGAFQVDGLPLSGECTLDLPDVKPAAKADPSAAGRVRFVEGGVKVKIGAAATVEVPPRVRRGRLTGLLFETDKAFLKPEAMTGIRMLKKLYASFPNLVVLVSGHTDRVGGAQHNLGLSEERADSVRHFLVDDADEWMKWYAGKKPNSKKWGTREDQHLLRTIKDSSGNAFYSGEVNGNLDGATRQAVKDFQHSRLLTETGTPDDDTRLEMVRAYMALDLAPLPKDPPLAIHGCGETHPLSPPGSPPDQQMDRRVEIFLFEEKIDPPPRTPCPTAGCTEYPTWVKQTVLTVDLDQPPGALAVKVVDADGAAVNGAHAHASGPLVLDGSSAADGTVSGFDEIVPGEYKVIADADGFDAADATLTVPSGGSTPVTLTLPRAATLENPRVTPVQQPGAQLSIRLLDLARRPVPNQEATVSAGAFRTFAVSDGQGVLKVQVPAGTKQITVTYAPPDAQSLVSWPLRLGLPAVDTEEGAVGRLLNLGYPADTQREFALFTFQADNGLPATVQLDAATKAKLVEIHGS